jgi:hypothetical protein
MWVSLLPKRRLNDLRLRWARSGSMSMARFE